MKKIGILFDYEDAWMMFLYEVSGNSCRQKKYWNINENFYEDSYELMEALSDEIIKPNFKTYDDLQNWLEDNSTDEFSLTIDDLDKLRKIK